ncbi:MAG: hypothetical protein MJY77_01290 [Bacteroidaceae bacterium]|nr:hypothetical protein [Bacteroidaceae bacterium]
MTDDEFRDEDLDDEKTVSYIRNTLPQELRERFPDDTLYYILDVINDYFATSGILDKEPDADGFIEIDNEAVADYIIREAKRDGMGNFDRDEVLLIVEAEADYVDGLED